MKLQLDAGNTRIKWRVTDNGKIVASGHQLTRTMLNGEPLELPAVTELESAQLSNVAGAAVEAHLLAQLRAQFAIDLQVAVVSQRVGLVSCGYQNPETLGIDRWLALLAAFHKHPAALVVVNAGSAVTVDIVDANGVHQGGYIVPGMRLMQEALWRGTDRVKVDQLTPEEFHTAGVTTEQAVGRGCQLMVLALIERLLYEQSLDKRAELIIAGGDGELLNRQLSVTGQYHPDLVLDGLSVEGVSFRAGVGK